MWNTGKWFFFLFWTAGFECEKVRQVVYFYIEEEKQKLYKEKKIEIGMLWHTLNINMISTKVFCGRWKHDQINVTVGLDW